MSEYVTRFNVVLAKRVPRFPDETARPRRPGFAAACDLEITACCDQDRNALMSAAQGRSADHPDIAQVLKTLLTLCCPKLSLRMEVRAARELRITYRREKSSYWR